MQRIPSAEHRTAAAPSASTVQQESSIDDGIAMRPRLLKQQKTEVETPPHSPKVGASGGLLNPGGLGILKNGGAPRFCTGAESFDMPNADGKYNDNILGDSPRIVASGSRRRSVFLRLKTLVMPSQQSMEESSGAEQGNQLDQMRPNTFWNLIDILLKRSKVHYEHKFTKNIKPTDM